jgi:hypothetical protein
MYPALVDSMYPALVDLMYPVLVDLMHPADRAVPPEGIPPFLAASS